MEDGAFRREIVDYYRNGQLLETSGSTPGDLRLPLTASMRNTDAQPLYLAYSAVTIPMQRRFWRQRNGLCHDSDTKQFPQGSAMVIAVAELLRSTPIGRWQKQSARREDLIARAKMCFMPENLEFLRAGGRVSNVAFLGAKLLNLHPVIEILDGKLVANEKISRKMKKVAVQMLTEYAEKYNLNDWPVVCLVLVGFPDAVRQAVEEAAKALGFQENPDGFRRR